MRHLIYCFLIFFAWNYSSSQVSPQVKDVALYLYDGVDIVDFAGPLEVFSNAGFNTYIVSRTRDPILVLGSIKVLPDYTIHDCPIPDILCFFGSGSAMAGARMNDVRKWIRSYSQKADINFSVSTGAFFLGEAGYLDGKVATTSRKAIRAMQRSFPKANIKKKVSYVDYVNLLTTGSKSTGVDGALQLVAKIKGEEYARKVAEAIEYDRWLPDKGLVYENPVIKSIKERGFKNTMEQGDDKLVVFKGELLNLADHLKDQDIMNEALTIADYVLGNYNDLNVSDCYTIGNIYCAAGKEAPPNEKEFLLTVEQGHFDEALAIFERTKRKYPNWVIFDPWKMNALGYNYMRENDLEKAIRVFKLNVLAYPDNHNTYDSLADGYLIAGMRELAMANFKKAMELNPNNDEKGFLNMFGLKFNRP